VLVVVHMPNAVCDVPSLMGFAGHRRATGDDGIIPHIADLPAGSRDVRVVGELAPVAGEPVVEHRPSDMCGQIDVEQWLRDRGVEAVVLVGAAAAMAVDIAADQLADRRSGLVVPAVPARSPAA
jgi:nicotinamidase-related amidase